MKVTREQLLYLRNKHKDNKPCHNHFIALSDTVKEATTCSDCGWKVSN